MDISNDIIRTVEVIVMSEDATTNMSPTSGPNTNVPTATIAMPTTAMPTTAMPTTDKTATESNVNVSTKTALISITKTAVLKQFLIE